MEYTTQLIAEGATPNRIDCVIVITERSPQDIVMHIDDLARKIRDDMAAEAAQALGHDMPLTIEMQHEDTGSRLLHDGYVLNSSTSISGGGRTVHLDL